MNWQTYAWRLAAGAVGLVAAVYAAVVVIDPYEIVPFSPPFDREPIARDQRYAVPGLVRKRHFDSAIFGSSTVRLLRPSYMNASFDASFVNLTINGPTSLDHRRALDVFLRYHPRPKVVIFGTDQAFWCRSAGDATQPQKRLPDALYDERWWVPLVHLLNWTAIYNMSEQFLYLAGLQEQKWSKDGYTVWPPPDRYDPVQARVILYRELELPPGPARVYGADEASRPPPDWAFGTLPLFEQMMASVPEETLRIAVLMPTHRVAFGAPGSHLARRLAECKRRIAGILARHANTHFLDFTFESEIARRDENFWDAVHVTLPVAERVQQLIADGVRSRQGQPDLFDYVVLGPAATTGANPDGPPVPPGG